MFTHVKEKGGSKSWLRFLIAAALLLLLSMGYPWGGSMASEIDDRVAKMQNEITLEQVSYAFTDDFESYEQGKWRKEGNQHGKWVLIYHGALEPDQVDVGVEIDEVSGSKVLSARPGYEPDKTRAVLVKSTQSFFGDIEVVADVMTVAQNRTIAVPFISSIINWASQQFDLDFKMESQNPWESAWLGWNYVDDNHFNYVYLKPGIAGGELGKRDTIVPEDDRCNIGDGQCHMHTLGFPSIPLGKYAEIRIVQRGAKISVYVDGEPVVEDFVDNFSDGPNISGHVVLYTEDAHVHFDNVRVRNISKEP